MTISKRKVNVPSDVLDNLFDQGEIKFDSIGRVRGFEFWVRRAAKRGGKSK